MSSELILPRAILFDMDGTLTKPLLDFPRIKSEMGIGNRPILEALAAMEPKQRSMAEIILARHEQEAAARSTLNRGCRELLGWLHETQVKTGLITRNSLQSTRTVLSLHRLRIEVLITRDDAPAKPDPAPLYLACQRLGTAAADTWMVGDGVFDIAAGSAAGMRTVWISHGRERGFAAEPWREAVDLPALLAMLQGAERD